MLDGYIYHFISFQTFIDRSRPETQGQRPSHSTLVNQHVITVRKNRRVIQQKNGWEGKARERKQERESKRERKQRESEREGESVREKAKRARESKKLSEIIYGQKG